MDLRSRGSGSGVAAPLVPHRSREPPPPPPPCPAAPAPPPPPPPPLHSPSCLPVPSPLLRDAVGSPSPPRAAHGGAGCDGEARAIVSLSSSSKDEKAEAGEKEGEPAFNPFWFVTQRHPAAVESPAQDGNVGQMLYTTEEKRGSTATA